MRKTKEQIKAINPYIWTSSDKSKFRATKPWKDFTKGLKEERCTCEICGNDNTKKLVVHHKYLNDDYRSYTNLDPERFVVLCQLCHKYIHRLGAMYNRKRNPPSSPNKWLRKMVDEMIILPEVDKGI